MDVLEKKNIEEEKKELDRIARVILDSFSEWPYIFHGVNPTVMDLIIGRIALGVVRPESRKPRSK